jgi:prolyl oligopeptidase
MSQSINMKLNPHFIYLLLLCFNCSDVLIAQTDALIYPEFQKCKQEDVYFGYKVDDAYRLLENQESDETKQWIDKENKLTRSYLSKIPNNFTLREQIKRNTEIEYLTPKKKGDYYFVLMSKFNGSELSIYFKKEISDYVYWEELFVTKDLKVNKNEHISITDYEVSTNSKYIAYCFDKNGSDWKEIKVADLQLQKNLDDHLYDIKFTSIVWRGNGFYYTKYDRDANAEQFKQLAGNGKLYYHKLGTTQDKDSLIFKKSGVSSNMFFPVVSKNERYLILNDHNPVQNTNTYYFVDFENKNQQNIAPLIKKSRYDFKYLGFEKDSLLFLTTINNEKKVIAIDPLNPLKWSEKIKSIENLNVQDVFYHNGRIFELCFYNQQDVIVVFDSKGNIIKKVEIPFGSSVSFKGIDEKSNKLLFSYESYLHPPIFASMDLTAYKFELLEKAKISYDMADYEIKKVMYKSDTAFVPLLLMHKKGLKLDGNNPLLLEFYGGFGKISKGGYDAGKISFIENGGIFAFAMIRGGGEKGLYWHKAGALFNRQKSINDIINGAQYLIDNKYTNTSKIAISGGSHGGLMTGAVAMQRPDLFAAVVPNVGNYDAFRFEKFTIGSFHADEYGTVKDSLQFLNLKSYSPLHNIKKGIKYPAIMIMTSNYDDRVPPLHSYKMTATMQELASKENPVLLRVEKNAGHNGARNYDKYIDETTDFYSFILNALGVNKYSNK